MLDRGHVARLDQLNGTPPRALRQSFDPFVKVLDLPPHASSELRRLEHLKHGVEHGQHDHVALHQPSEVIPSELVISCLVKHIKRK